MDIGSVCTYLCPYSLTCHPLAHPDTSHIAFTYPPAAFMRVVTLHHLLYNRTHPYTVTFIPIGSGYFRVKPSPVWIPQLFSNLVILHPPAYEDGTECSETSAYKIQTPGNYPEERIKQSNLSFTSDMKGQSQTNNDSVIG